MPPRGSFSVFARFLARSLARFLARSPGSPSAAAPAATKKSAAPGEAWGAPGAWAAARTTAARTAALLGCCAGALAGCRERAPTLLPPVFTDRFDRGELGPQWRITAPPGVYRIDNEELAVRGAHNHPAWLVRELPREAVIEVDARSLSIDGDIKLELWGDGKSFATEVEYTSSGYVFIHGGWKNRLTALCRLEEHGHDRKVRQDLQVVPGKTYHYMIVRKGRSVKWFIDGELALQLDDPAPLEGPGHAYLGLDNWETELRFDNLTIRPLG